MARFSAPVLVLALLLAMTMAISVESSYLPYEVQLGLDGRGEDGDGDLVDGVIDPYEELSMESESGSARRSLAGRSYISYEHDALGKNNVPCNSRGHSYYNCRRNGRANP